MMGVQLNEGLSFGVHWKMGDPKWRGGGDQKLGGTKMLGVQLDRDPILGCTMEEGGPRMGGSRGERKTGGTKMMGV